jgi:hypothetical protein
MVPSSQNLNPFRVNNSSNIEFFIASFHNIAAIIEKMRIIYYSSRVLGSTSIVNDYYVNL